jgi:hypothetical protein
MHANEPGLPATLCHMLKSRFCMFWTELLASTIPDSVERHPESRFVALRSPSQPLPYALEPMPSYILY